MTQCKACGEVMTGMVCDCGWQATKPPGTGAGVRSVVSAKTGLRYYLCAWNHTCQMPVRTNPDTSLTVRLCRWHAQCETAPDQATRLEAFYSWHSHLLSLKGYHYGWWERPAQELWLVVQGDRSYSSL